MSKRTEKHRDNMSSVKVQHSLGTCQVGLRTRNQGRCGNEKQWSSLCSVGCKNDNYSYSQTVDISQNVIIAWKENPDFMKDPRGILQGNLNHIHGKLSIPGKENKQLWAD